LRDANTSHHQQRSGSPADPLGADRCVVDNFKNA